MKGTHEKYWNKRQFFRHHISISCCPVVYFRFFLGLLSIMLICGSLDSRAGITVETATCVAPAEKALFFSFAEDEKIFQISTSAQTKLRIVGRSENCSSDYSSYTVLFEIMGGNPSSYKVTDKATGQETGCLLGGFFESDLIRSGTSYSYLVSDGNAANTLMVEGFHDCGQSKMSQANNTHGKVLPAENTKPKISAEKEKSSSPAGIQKNQKQKPGSASTASYPIFKVKNLSESCTQDKAHYSVLFEISGGHSTSYSVIDNSTGLATGSLLGGFFESDLILSHTAYSFSVYDADGQDALVVNGFRGCKPTTPSQPDSKPARQQPVEKTITRNAASDKKPSSATGIQKATGPISRESYPVLEVINRSESCTQDKANYTVLFEILGGDPDYYTVIDNRTGKETGSLFVGLFESNLIRSATEYSFSVFDSQGSDTVVVKGFHNCGRPVLPVATKATSKKPLVADKDSDMSPPIVDKGAAKTTSLDTKDPGKAPVVGDKGTGKADLPVDKTTDKVAPVTDKEFVEVHQDTMVSDEDEKLTDTSAITNVELQEIKVEAKRNEGPVVEKKQEEIDAEVGMKTRPKVDLGPDKDSIESESCLLEAGYFDSYSWSNGATTASIKVTETGVYSVTVTNIYGLTGTDEIAVTFKPVPVAEVKPEITPKKKTKKATNAAKYDMGEPDYEEISLFLDVPGLGGGDIDVLIKGNEVYLPVIDLFDFLKIRNVYSKDMDTISGFFINQDATYSIDRMNQQIMYEKDIYKLKPDDIIRTEWNLYLRGSYFGEIFGLECSFNFRNMSVLVLTQLELPVIREMRLAEMRENIKHLKGEVKADTVIKRNSPFFSLGTADWAANVTEQINGPTVSRLNLSLGSILAGGEANVTLNYGSESPFTEKQQYYLWRRVNNDNRFLRQVRAGKITTQSTASIFNPVVGVQFTNTPTTFRKSFGSYTLSDKTGPGWIVELYVNNVMVDYVQADASGFFTFEVPLVYGNSMVKLKFYGPWGEEQTREQNIIIPFSFIPVKTLEYTVSAGMVEDSIHSQFSKASINYGLSRKMTLGGGVEYLSSLPDEPIMPFLNGSVRLTSNLLLWGEYTHGVRSKGTLSYRLKSNVQFTFDYTNYDKDQKAINYNYREERKISVSAPIRFRNFTAYNRISVNQLVLPTTQYTTSEWLLSGSLFGINLNITTYALFVENKSPYVYSYFSTAMRLPFKFTLLSQAQYGYAKKEIISAKLGLEKKIFKDGFLTLSYEQNFKSNLQMGELGFRYDFDFAQTGYTARQSKETVTLVQNARGSLIYDRKTKYLSANKHTSVGKGGITIIAFLDKNGNGELDTGEPKAYGLNLRSSGGRIEMSKEDTIIRIMGLEPFTDVFIELDQNSLDNIAWRLKNRTMMVTSDPNRIKLIEVPIVVVGEAAGTVMIERGGQLCGIGRVIVNFYDKDQNYIGKTLSEEDGYFSYFGLAPGSYSARIDDKQIGKLNMFAEPETVEFKVSSNINGDYVDGLDFTLNKKPDEGHIEFDE